MRAFILSVLMVAAALPLLVAATPAYAQVPGQTGTELFGNLQQAGETGAGYSSKGRTDPLSMVTKVIKVVMSLLGIIFLALTVYGGFLWMTAGGNEQNVEKAKKVISAGVIGLAIILSGYIISINVLSALLRASGQTPAPLGPI